MPNTEEQRLDVIDNCTILLQGILRPFDQTDGTPEGRMIAQLKWLKERAENHDLPLPVDEDMLSTLRYVYTNGELCRHASSREKVHEEIDVYMQRLMRLTLKAQLLLKPPYYPYAIRYIDALLRLLRTAPRPLDRYEQGSIAELEQLKQLLAEGKIEPPLGGIFPKYPNFGEVHSLARNSTDDLPNGKLLTNTVANLLFNGVRPDSWLTPEAADRDTANL